MQNSNIKSGVTATIKQFQNHIFKFFYQLFAHMYLQMSPRGVTYLSAVFLMSYLPWRDLVCSLPVSCLRQLSVSKYPCGSDTCQCAVSPNRTLFLTIILC